MQIPVAANIYTNPTPPLKRFWRNQGQGVMTILFLLIAYIGFTVLRYWLTLKYSANPFILPDEMVYSNFARSIYEDFTIAMRNRPASYDNILYPLLLAPLYGLPTDADLFRCIQLINHICVNLAVFPAYGIACFFTKKRWLRIVLALAALLMPDIVLAGRVMTEGLTYPLFLLVVWLCFKGFDHKNPWYQLLPAFVSLLLYMGKSGGIGLTVAYGAVLVLYGIREWKENGSKEMLIRAAVFIGGYALMFLGFRLFMIYGLNNNYALENLYASQTNAISFQQIGQTIVGTALYSFYTIIGFGVLPLLVPFFHWRDYPASKRKQVLFMVIALTVYIISISYIFYGSEGSSVDLSGRVHTRYLFPFIPVFWAMSAYPLTREQSKLNTGMFIALSLAMTFLIGSGFDSVISDRTMPVDAVLLSHITHDFDQYDIRKLFTHIYIFLILSGGWLVYKQGWTGSVRKIFGVFLAMIIILTNITGYDTNRHNLETALAEDVKWMVQELEGEENVLLIGANNKYFDNHLSALDVSMRTAPYMIMVADMNEQLGPYGTLQKEYTTPQYWMEDISQPIPQGSVMVFSSSSKQKLKYLDSAETWESPNGYYVLARPNIQNRVFHSVLAGIFNYVPQHNAAVWVFDETVLSQSSVSVGMYVKSEASTGSFKISYGTKNATFNCTTTGEWVYFSVRPDDGATHLKMPITDVTGDVMVVDISVR